MTWVQLEDLSDFYVKRSGARVTLACGPCGRRCGSWPIVNLADVVKAAVAHSGTALHAAALAANASRQGDGDTGASLPGTPPAGVAEVAR